MVRSINYKYVFVIILAFYCLVLSQFGFENFDTGYIPSFSWRILNGQSVYEDFIYKGPPVTLYFHALFMGTLPEMGQFFLIRILSYLLFALHVFLCVTAFDNIYDLRKLGIDKWGIICVCFVISLLNFSPYPWPTTDGLLFAAIAFWMMSRFQDSGFFALLAISFFAVLSALTKQSFYLVPVFFLFWVFVKYNLKKTIIFVLQLSFFVAFYFGWILSITDFKNFIHQTTGQTPLFYLFYTGLHNFIYIPVFWFAMLLMLVAIVAVAYLRMTDQKPRALLPVLKWISVALFALAITFCLFKEVRMASRIGFDAAIIAVLYKFFEKRHIAPVIVALGIAWSSSISLGYQYPILFSTGILLGFIALMGEELNINPKWYFWMALPVCIISVSYNLEPYREKNIFTLGHSLADVSPKLKYIKTNSANFEKHMELKKLVSKYGKNFLVAPNIPMAHYLFNTQSPLPADWIIETEIDQQQKRFIRLASEKRNYIFLEKSFLEHEDCMPPKMEDFSSIAAFIYRKFNLIEETRYFMVYNSLKKDEKLP